MLYAVILQAVCLQNKINRYCYLPALCFSGNQNCFPTAAGLWVQVQVHIHNYKHRQRYVLLCVFPVSMVPNIVSSSILSPKQCWHRSVLTKSCKQFTQLLLLSLSLEPEKQTDGQTAFDNTETDEYWKH